MLTYRVIAFIELLGQGIKYVTRLRNNCPDSMPISGKDDNLVVHDTGSLGSPDICRHPVKRKIR
jgi:hypothetical protein